MFEDLKQGIERWIDIKGQTITIKSFFSKVYIDSEMERLSEEYDIWKCDGKIRLSSLGKGEKERFAARILGLVRAVSDNNGLRLVGVKQKELEAWAMRSSENWFIDEFIEYGFLRVGWVKGELVIFPTEKLLENQRVSKRKIYFK